MPSWSMSTYAVATPSSTSSFKAAHAVVDLPTPGGPYSHRIRIPNDRCNAPLGNPRFGISHPVLIVAAPARRDSQVRNLGLLHPCLQSPIITGSIRLHLEEL